MLSYKASWKVFNDAGKALDFDFPTSNHGLRKTFANMMCEVAPNNRLVVDEIGWQDEKLLRIYAGTEEQARISAFGDLHKKLPYMRQPNTYRKYNQPR